MDIGFIGGAYAGRARAVNVQKSLNLFVDVDPYDAAKKSLVGSPGLSLFATAGGGPVRGMIEHNSVCYAVSADTLYEVASDGTATSRGQITGSGRVSMADDPSGNEIMITNGSGGYIYDSSAQSLTAMTDSTLTANGSDVCTFQDGHFFFNVRGTKQFGLTVLTAGIGVFGYGSADGAGADVVAVMSDHRTVYVMTEQSCELYYNSGDSDFPFERFQGGFMETGCAAPHTLQQFDNGMIWLNSNKKGEGMVVMSTGTVKPQVVSPPQINWQISQMTTISDAFGFVYQDEGHEFYEITFPTANKTFVYDALTKEWHQRSSSLDTGSEKRHLANCHAHAYNKHLVGSYADGKIYTMSTDVYDEEGDEIIRERVGQHLSDQNNTFRIKEVEVLFEPGQGLITGQGSDPTVSMSWSKDHGNTWSSWLERSIGKMGKYNTRAVWRKLGWGRDWVFRIRCSDPVKFVITGARVALPEPPKRPNDGR